MFEEEDRSAYAVNSLIDVNSSHRIFYNSASESVITFGNKTFRRVSINDETTTQERKAQNSSTLSGVIDPVRVLSIRSDPIRSDPVRSGPIQTGPINILPTAANIQIREVLHSKWHKPTSLTNSYNIKMTR